MNLPLVIIIVVAALIAWTLLSDRRESYTPSRQSALRGVLEKTKDKCLGAIKRAF